MRRSQRGFTFVEAGLCIVVITLLAAVTYPNVVREAQSREHRLFRIRLRDWVASVKTRAIETRTTVALTFDRNGQSLQAVEEDSRGASKPLPVLKLPEGITTEQFAADSNESPSEGWRVPFFSDGTTTGGGAQFKDGETEFSLIIDPVTGVPRVLDGILPNLSFESWQAGGVQKRAS